jgi:hypothetical protein
VFSKKKASHGCFGDGSWMDVEREREAWNIIIEGVGLIEKRFVGWGNATIQVCFVA